MIEVQNLTKYYGSAKAIDNLSFSVKSGDVVGLLGPNGAGKTTTMKIITGFMPPSSGHAFVDGMDVFEQPIEVKSMIGFLPEHPPLFSEMKVIEYLKFVAALRQVPDERIKSFVGQAVEKSQLESVQNQTIQYLSKGFKQRVGIAQAIVSQPKILIFDEPTVGLDPRQVTEVRGLLKQLKGEHTIIISTHLLSEVEMTCNRVIIINEGKIIEQEGIDELRTRHSGQCRVDLVVRRNSDQLISKVKEKISDLRVEVQGKDIFLELPYSEESLEIISSIAAALDCGLIELKAKRKGLEDIFIRMTESFK